jgi:DtxR family Mn-dependent transcriptional regulator
MIDDEIEPEIMLVKVISLQDLPLNCKAEIITVEADKRVVQRLNALGFFPGTEIQKRSQAPFHGPIQIEVRGTRIALGFGLASKITVRILSNISCK